MSATHWNLLRNYQSHDFVTRLYQTHNGRIPGAQTAKEITSCFVQAEEYFRNAASAANSVKPLLLYYGVLSFAKGVVLFLNPIKREATMKASHGVETLNWKETFANGISSVMALQIRITDGTFTELYKANKTSDTI